jgi:hypothetical protein
MSAIDPAEAALTRWMRPSVALGWIAHITGYSRRRRLSHRRDYGEAAFRMLLSRDWVTLDLPAPRSSHGRH